jgi:hypothetical protein
VYWSQARLVDQILADADADLTGVTDVIGLAAHLRDRDALIVCGPDSVAIEKPEFDEPEPAAGDHAGCGQLALPFPRTPQQRPGTQFPKSDQGDPAPNPENTEPPSRSTEGE